MSKTFILDTNLLLLDSEAMFNFKEHNVVIPIGVIEEIDKFKKDNGELGRNARQASRHLDDLSLNGDLSKGIKLKGGGKLFVYSADVNSLYKEQNVDLHIIQTAQKLAEKDKKREIIIVSRDTNVRLKARALGLLAEDYNSNKVDEVDKGYDDIVVEEKIIASFELDGWYDCTKLKLFAGYNPNHYFCLKSDNSKFSSLARLHYEEEEGETKLLLKKLKDLPMDLVLQPKNREQTFVIDALLDDNVKLVCVSGIAGCGKTLLSAMCGWRLVDKEKKYDRLLVARPIVPMGNDIGYLPGPQPLDAKILTPSGWTTMGQLKVGDYVVSRDGKPTKVLGIFKKGIKDVYKVSTTDGTSTEACIDHLWMTQTWENHKRGKVGTVKTTKQIIDTLKTNKGKTNHYLPRCEAVEFFQEKELPMPAYSLGCLLGDGSICEDISLSNTDEELVKRVKEEAKEIECSVDYVGNITYRYSSNLYNNKPAKLVSITNNETGVENIYNSIGIACKNSVVKRGSMHDRCTREVNIAGCSYKFVKNNKRWTAKAKNIIFDLGLLGKKAWDKFIPKEYLYASIDSRIQLLRGLMDTDGNCKKNGEAGFTTTSLQLSKDVVELVRGLGGRCYVMIRNRIGRGGAYIKGRPIISRRISYEIGVSLPEHINPFYISRKANRYSKKYTHKAAITSVELVGKKETQCILVDNPEHLYITDDYIVTHNTAQEKLDPWMTPIYDSFDVILGASGKKKNATTNNGKNFVLASDKINIEPLTYIRGRSIHQQFVLIDESQNLSPLEVKTIITRAGQGTKIVLTGDIEQIDNPYVDKYSNGLSTTMDAFRTSRIAAHIMMSKGVRSELSEEATNRL